MTLLKGFHLPGYTGATTRRIVGDTEILLPVLTPDDIKQVADHLGRGRERLLQYSTDDLADIFGQVAEFWQEESAIKSELCRSISALTGLSHQVVSHSIDIEQGNSSRADILAAMDRDLGSHKVLDGFVYNEHLGDRTRCFGPSMVGGILTANVPGLSYLPMVRSLMVKAPFIAKLASNEPLFGPAWVQAVERIEPDLGQCIGLCQWQGSNPALAEALFSPCDTIILYGSEQTIHSLRSRIPRDKKIIEHGHKIGLVLIGQAALTDEVQARELAQRVAMDIAVFDQRACIAPQMAYVEQGGSIDAPAFCGLLEDELLQLETILPPSAMSVDTGASLAMERNCARFKAAQDRNYLLFERGSATLILDPDPGFHSVLPTRFLRVCPVASLHEVLPILAPFGSYLQNVGIETDEQTRYALAEQLGRFGVSRITRPGLMHKPSMRWKHDGLSSFSELVRWVDMEME
ncbi:MAG: hypothetical protein PF442_06040 [Desulfobulbaceae bacterium]|jgi:hypothetical protein|nr:hypothetical protein [Desulfobulbaceae bacterium]